MCAFPERLYIYDVGCHGLIFSGKQRLMLVVEVGQVCNLPGRVAGAGVV